MPLKARFCSQCGANVELRLVDGRRREVCSACETVFYRNPLPVAASVVLGRKRDVLLVLRKNEPHRGHWCLPMGFAEIGETISDAALRELREEAGVDGRIVRLLDSDSYDSDHYGELLIVTFEVEVVGGEPEPGDDAEEVAWYSLDHLPSFPFSSNAKALRACIEAHREEWAIHDSFHGMGPDEGDRELLSDALVLLVQENAREVVQLWFDDVRVNTTTTSYQRLPADELFDRGHTAVSQFGRWLKGNEAAAEVRAFYFELGRERRAQGFELHELLSSLMLLKKYTWSFSLGQGVWERSIDVYRALELSRRTAAFFDRAMYHTVMGFEGTTSGPQPRE